MLPKPIRAATPPNPIARPSDLQSPNFSCSPKNRWINAIDNGTIAIRIPATDELIQRSPSEIAEKGKTNSASEKAQIGPRCPPKERSAPPRQAMGSNIRVLSNTRLKAITAGDTSTNESLMKKYGNPQIKPSAANALHPLQLKALPQSGRSAIAHASRECDSRGRSATQEENSRWVRVTAPLLDSKQPNRTLRATGFEFLSQSVSDGRN